MDACGIEEEYSKFRKWIGNTEKNKLCISITDDATTRGLQVTQNVAAGEVLMELPWRRIICEPTALRRLQREERAGRGLLPFGVDDLLARFEAKPQGYKASVDMSTNSQKQIIPALHSWTLLVALQLLCEFRHPGAGFQPYVRLLPTPPGGLLRALAPAGPRATDALLFPSAALRRLRDPALAARVRADRRWLKQLYNELFVKPLDQLGTSQDGDACGPEITTTRVCAHFKCRKEPSQADSSFCAWHAAPACSWESFVWAHALVRSRAMELELAPGPGLEAVREALASLGLAGAVALPPPPPPPPVGSAAARPLPSPPPPLLRAVLPFVDMANHDGRPGAACRLAAARGGVRLVANRDYSANCPVFLNYGEKSPRELFRTYCFASPSFRSPFPQSIQLFTEFESPSIKVSLPPTTSSEKEEEDGAAAECELVLTTLNVHIGGSDHGEEIKNLGNSGGNLTTTAQSLIRHLEYVFKAKSTKSISVLPEEFMGHCPLTVQLVTTPLQIDEGLLGGSKPQFQTDKVILYGPDRHSACENLLNMVAASLDKVKSATAISTTASQEEEETGSEEVMLGCSLNQFNTKLASKYCLHQVVKQHDLIQRSIQKQLNKYEEHSWFYEPPIHTRY